MVEATIELTVHLHTPHAKQLEVKESTAKRKAIAAGRRGGKTTIASILAVEGMLNGHRVLEVAPTAEQTDRFWELCKEALAELIRAGIVYKNETTRLLQIPGLPGRIKTKTAWDADTLRGDFADLLILDEFSLMDPSAWDEVGAPMLLDNDGDAIFIFTPKRRNHAHAMYVRALGDETGRWQAWNFTSHDNPYLSKEALSEITQDMTEDAYRQEIMAEFLENEGAVFRNIQANMIAPLTTPGEHPSHGMVMGVDWGKSDDFTTISVVCQWCHQEVDRDRFNQIDYHVQRARVVSLAQKWQIGRMLPEANAMGAPIIDELARDPALRTVDIEPFTTSATSKPPLIESLALALERQECQWQPDKIWQAELEAYEVSYGPSRARPSYGAPAGVHDDTVICRALAWWAVSNPGRGQAAWGANPLAGYRG